MKKYSVLLILVCLIFIVSTLSGCVSDSYFQPLEKDNKSTSSEEDDLMKEIEEIEKALAGETETDEAEPEAEEECEEVCETTCEDVCTTDEETNETTCEEECTETCTTVCEEAEGEEVAPVEDIDTGSLERLEVDETDLVDMQIEVSDADEDTVTYTFSSPLDENGQWQTNYGDAGEYIIAVTATDGTASSEKKVLLVVNKKNVPPVIEDLESKITVDEGEIISLEPKISDPNKDEVEVTFSEPFDALGVWETDHTSAGTYEITVTASDGEMASEAVVEVVVNDINMPPVISLDGIEDVLTVNEGETVEIAPEVSDLDGDDVAVSISEPVGDDGVWETGYTDHGEYEITISADDGKDVTTLVITLIVEDVNMPPEIIDINLG